MDIKSGRMVFLGYGKYWRSDRIVGMVPIEDDRGPGRRTDVFVEDRAQPIVASRTEDAILADLGATDDKHAGSVYGTYTGSVWFAAIFGGLIADRWLGHYRSVLWGGIIIALGHF